MFDDQLFGFLGGEEEQLNVKIGGEFKLTGLTGPWVLEVLYSHASQSEFSREEIGYDIKRELGGWHWYYWKSADAADVARDMVGAQYGASTEWVHRVATADIVSFSSEEARGKWGDDIFFSSRVVGFGSMKYRHEFNLISLPSAVAAVAELQGWDTPGFSLEGMESEDGYKLGLFDLTSESSEEDCLALIGGKDGAGKVLPWTESVLGKQRAALWAALDEPEVKATRPRGSMMSADKPDKLATASEKLDFCLRIFYRAWRRPAWVTVMQVPDPRPDAVGGSAGNRFSIPALTAIFPDEAAALASLGEDGGTAAVTSQTGAPPIPEKWKDHPKYWENQMAEIMELTGSKPLPVIYDDMGGETALSCTAEELSTWVNYLKAQ